jgi:polysaccharide deacetylase family protein (PEP-CTERM system associated)
MNCIFSIDVEDWYHILDLPTTPPIAQWASLPSRVEGNFLKLLATLAETKAKATCFFLGWIAEKYPHLVREAAREGHEIASHGYGHRLAYEMTPKEFFEDALRSKKILEEITGEPVWGYRASGFSVTLETPWFFETLMQAGYRYDSSVFPAPRGHGGLPGGNLAPYRVESSTDFVEFPASVERVAGKPVCFFGGGYLRLFPYTLIRSMTRRVLRQGRPVIFYVHPREVDLESPRLPMGWTRQFKSYVNISTTQPKIRRILRDFEMVTFREFLINGRNGQPTANLLPAQPTQTVRDQDVGAIKV